VNTDGAQSNKGIGTGEAQIFAPTQTDYISKIGEMKYKRQQGEKARGGQVLKSLDALDKIDIFPKHQKMFAEKQQQLWDFVNKNIDGLSKNDPGKTMEFQEMKQNFFNDAQLSKTIKEDYKTYATMVAKDPYKYRSSTQDYLNEFSGVDPQTGEFASVDPLQFKENIDYSEHVLKDLSPVALKQSERGDQEYFDAKQNAYVTTGGKVFSKDKAYKVVYNDVMNNPMYLDQAADEFSKLAPEEKSQYKDPADYFAQIHSPALVVNAPSYKISKTTGSDTYTEEDYIKNPQQVNIEEISTVEGGENVPQTFSTYGKIAHKNPYNANLSISPDWIDKSGNVKAKKSANTAVSLGETMIVPVYKGGPKKGTAVPDTDIENTKKLKNVEFKVYATGTTKEGTGVDAEIKSYMIPVGDVENVLKNKGVRVDQMKADAEKLNKQIGGKTVVKKFQNTTSKKTKFVYSDGSEEIVDGLK